MKLRILTQAIEDLESGRAYYEDKERGLGDYFIHCLSNDI